MTWRVCGALNVFVCTIGKERKAALLIRVDVSTKVGNGQIMPTSCVPAHGGQAVFCVTLALQVSLAAIEDGVAVIHLLSSKANHFY